MNHTTVINKISSCRVVLSSSLHGLIVADSYGIPNMRIARDDVITGNWKWKMWFISITLQHHGRNPKK